MSGGSPCPPCLRGESHLISLLRGTIESKTGDRAVLNVGGVGYEVLVPASTSRTLPSSGAEASLFTELIVREDSLTLYGFATELERSAFRLLLTVSGVGPRTGLAILSGVGVADLANAIRHGSLAPFTQISGVGKKTAERVILELKDKVASFPVAGGAAPAAPATAEEADDERVRDAVEALLALGLPSPRAKLAVGRAHGVLAGKGSVAELVKEALKHVQDSR